MKILVVNGGSSSYKLSLFDFAVGCLVEPLWEGRLEWGRKEIPLLMTVNTASGSFFQKTFNTLNVEDGLKCLIESLWKGNTQVVSRIDEIEKIGHRVVHGGVDFEAPTLINSFVKEKIARLIPLAPLHNPGNLQGIEWMEKYFPLVPQIAIFDTAFHATMPEKIKTYPVPWQWKEMGVQRYGFHGISHHYCAERAAEFLKKNLVI